MKFAPAAVLASTSGTVVPSGATRLSARLASFGSVTLTLTLRFETFRPVLAIGIVEVRVPPLGMSW